MNGTDRSHANTNGFLSNDSPNGHTNGHTNGSSNGHTNGQSNGSLNRQTTGSNSHSNGHTNGSSNGQTNGSTNGHAKGSTALPPASSPTLILTHPTPTEQTTIWTLNSTEWGGALSLPDYLARESHVSASALCRSGGLSHWILTDSSPPDTRPILACAESIRKRAWVKTPSDEGIRDVLTHGIGGVFCFPEYRGHGYASRLMTELGKRLATHQAQPGTPVGFSVLWSDIGKRFYTKHGWHAFPSTHIEFPPSPSETGKDGEADGVKLLYTNDLPKLAAVDEALIRASMLKANDGKTHIAIAPDVQQLDWHRAREVFLTTKLFGRVPDTRGACVGEKGERMWMLWTRAYYGALDREGAGNTLHVLRLVIEDEDSLSSAAQGRVERMREGLRKLVKAAQREAGVWRLRHVEVWNPSVLVRELVEGMGIEHAKVEREMSSIPSLMWYGEGGGTGEGVEWRENQKYSWC